MSSKEEIQNELEGFSPTLAKIKSSFEQNSIDLPDDYFSNLQANLQEQLFDNEHDNSGKIKKLWKYFALAAAACVAIFVITRNPVENLAFPQLEELSSNELFLFETVETDDMEAFLEAGNYSEAIDAESILLEEDNLEELLNM